MTNIFDSSSYRTGIPQDLVCGDFWAWKIPIGDYGAGYDMKFILTPLAGGTIITVSSVQDSESYLFEVSATTTATYTPTSYKYSHVVIRTSDSSRGVIQSGVVALTPNPATTTTDIRSHARKVLDAIRATLEGRATNDQMSMSINGRSISRTPLADLLALENRYSQLVQREEKELALKNGIGRTNRQILVRLA